MKKYKKVLYIIVLILLMACAIIHFLSVSWEAGVYGGGYKSYIYNKYIGKVVPLYADNHKEYVSVSANTLSDYNITWKGRNLYLEIKLDVVGSDGKRDMVIAEFIGKRFWIEKFSWKERKINSLSQ